MSTTILTTKLYTPSPRPLAVPRPRLIDHLNRNIYSSLVLVSAPAGFGKTTIISQWITNHPYTSTSAWLSLDQSDKDPLQFTQYLIATLQTVDANIGVNALAELDSPQPPPLETVIASILNDIATLETPVILVLDDYHVIDSSEIDNLLTYLLEHSPTQLRLVISTREDPNLPFARMRALGDLVELRAADLRFSPEEATKFLNQAMNLNLSLRDIDALEQRTEGWIAGLQLAALSLQGNQDVSTFIENFTGNHHFVLDYLLEETLQRQPQEIQDFLLNTSILQTLSAPLCDAIMQTEGAANKNIAYLEQANLFIVPLDNKRESYRYHHLFADVLKARLSSQHPERIPILHLKASQWFEHRGSLTDAIHHTFIANDLERAADLIEQVWPEADRYVQTAPWVGWLTSLPDSIFERRPVLRSIYAWALLDLGEMEAAEIQLKKLAHWVEQYLVDGELPEVPPPECVVVDNVQYRRLRSDVTSAYAYLYQTRGDVEKAIEYYKKSCALLPVEDESHIGASGMMAIAQVYVGDLEQAFKSFYDTMQRLRRIGKESYSIGGSFILGDLKMILGKLYEAENIYKQFKKLLPNERPYQQGAAYLFMGLSKIYREWNRLEDAEYNLRLCEDVNNDSPMVMVRYRMAAIEARLRESQGDLEASLALLEKAEKLYYRNIVPEFQPTGALKARLYLKLGRIKEAEIWAKEQQLSTTEPSGFLREFENITLVRILIAQYQSNPSEEQFEELIHFIKLLRVPMEETQRFGNLIELLILQSIALKLHNDTHSAVQTLEDALKLAKAEGYIRIFIDEGKIVEELLRLAAKNGNHTEYANRLLVEFGENKKPGSEKALNPSGQTLIEPLSKREQQVLKLIAEGLSNQAISERLFLALSSVKGHNQKIFAKLQVSRRTEAVAKARELGLV